MGGYYLIPSLQDAIIVNKCNLKYQFTLLAGFAFIFKITNHLINAFEVMICWINLFHLHIIIQ